MEKRKRMLPPTIDRNREMDANKEKRKKIGKRTPDAGKQTRLNFHTNISSDSDDPTGADISEESDNDFVDNQVPINSKKKANGQAQGQPGTESPKVVNSVEYPTEFTTGGITIKFPFEPYQSQKDMMSSIIEALQSKENALLESPTGSGKSLALLCGALAWLESYKKGDTGGSKQSINDITHQMKEQGIVESPYFATESSIIATEKNFPSSSSKSYPMDPTLKACTNTSDGDFISCCKKGILEEHHMTTCSHNIDEIPNEVSDDTEADKEPQDGDLVSRMRWRKAMELTYDSDDPKSSGDNLVRINKSAQEAQTRTKIPKIYFGSRTHKQLTQLVKELKANTTYRPKMVVLGSRNHYCINPELKKVVNKNDACQELLDSEFTSCYYKHHSNKLSDEISRSKKHKIWDMEDLISKGKSLSACPYFASRTLASEAELVFCPYNYLIDPHIRKAMEIDLENSILILDEAHNIEDASREAGGLEIVDEDLSLAAEQFEELCAQNILANSSSKLRNLAKMFISIIKNQSRFSVKEYEQSTEIWTSREILSKLDRYGLNQNTLQDFYQAYNDISKALKEQKERKKQENDDRSLMDPDDNQEGESKDPPDFSVSPRVLRMTEGIIVVISRLLDPDLDCLDDYKIALVESVSRSIEKTSQSLDESGDPEDESSNGVGPKRRKIFPSRSQTRVNEDLSEKRRELKFWCMNPGVIFRPLSLLTRSVILTSGTLSPMESFASELQTSFKVRLEASHVIDKSQVWAGVIPYGPSLVKIDGTYRSASSFPFQDELGRVIEKIIETTPHGVLCFLSSYTLLDNMINRWKATGQYNRLCDIKKVILEPRRATNKQFDKVLKDFYSHISRHVKKGTNGGAILFAVFRGKCSEGIDFTDSNCRAVLAVSIPFPGLGDLKVKLKKEYNDQQSSKHRQQNQLRIYPGSSNSASTGLGNVNLQGLNHSICSSNESMRNALTIQKIQNTRSLLSGNRWYEIQAFRALNQAIGRCIRHRRDWGAMVLLDYRFTQSNNQLSLSKWVRPLVRTFREFGVGIDSMQDWIKQISEKAKAGKLGGTDTVKIEKIFSVEDAGRPNDQAIFSSDGFHQLETTDANTTLQYSPAVENCDQSNTIGSIINQESIIQEKSEVGLTANKVIVSESQIHIGASDTKSTNEYIDEWDGDAAWVLSAEDCLELDNITNEQNQIKPTEEQVDTENDSDLCDELWFDFNDDLDEEDIRIKMDSSSKGSLMFEKSVIRETIEFSPTHSIVDDNSIGSIMSSRNIAINAELGANDADPRYEETKEELKDLPNLDRTKVSPISTDVENALQTTRNGSRLLTNTKLAHQRNIGLTQTPSRPQEILESDFINIVCRTCSNPILSCSEKPKIKPLEKSMAHELIHYGMKIISMKRSSGTSLPMDVHRGNGNIGSSSGKLGLIVNRNDQSQISPDMNTQYNLPAMVFVYVLEKSNIRKMFTETQYNSDEPNCVWRPQDGLFYQKIICSQCSSASGKTSSQNIIAGWKGVVIVGHSKPEIGDNIEIGTMWFIPGEIGFIL